MTRNYPMNSEDFRTLEPDDVQGICTVYPPARATGGNSCDPCNGFSSTCGTAEPLPNTSYPMTCTPTDPSGGCQLAPARRRSTADFSAAIAACAVAAFRSLRRRRRDAA
jgi:hypothetical protein